MSTSPHPPREQLAAYVRAELPEPVEEAVADHLERCESCEETVSAFEHEAGTLFGRLPGPRSPEPFVDEPRCQEVLERIRAEGPRPAEVAPTELYDGSSPPAAAVPTQLREYRILEKLGQGGMGTVYKALHTKLDKLVALKVLPAAAMQDAELVARFEREMKAVGKLEHPNIVRAMDAGCHEGTHFLVMEYVDGMDLTGVAKRCGPLRIADACEVIRQAALGLNHADEHALVHRDIKPSNLVLSPNGEVKILDLGLALLQAERMAGNETTSQGRAMGTVDYMAPEQARDSHLVDIRADIYSLGCTLYKLLTGAAPYSGPEYKSNFDKLMAHVTRPFPAIQPTRPDVPKRLAAVLERMVAKDREARYMRPREVVEDLKPFCSGSDLAGLLIQARKQAKAGALGACLPTPGPAGKVPAPYLPSPSGGGAGGEGLGARSPIGPSAGGVGSPIGQAEGEVRRPAPSAPPALGAGLPTPPTPPTVRSPAESPEDEGAVFARLLGDLSTPPPVHAHPSRRKTSPAARVQEVLRRVPLHLRIATACAAAVVFLGIIIKIRTGNQEVTIAVPDKAQITIQQEPPGGTAGSSSSMDTKATSDAPPLAIAPFDAAQARKHQEAWAKHLGVKVEITNAIGMKFVLIPPGEFMMGSPPELIEEESRAHGGDGYYLERLLGESSQHRVRITKPFYLGATEVTQEEYHRVMGSNPSEFQGDPKRPVEQVSWDDAVEFSRRLSELPGEITTKRRYGLPTEAQWEYACRAGSLGAWCFSPHSGPFPLGEGERLLGEYAWFKANAGGQTHVVGQKRVSAWGLYDIHGNVWEWCQDWYESDYYAKSPTDDPVGPTASSYRVSRGGGCYALDTWFCRSAYRNHFPGAFSCHLGFRVCLVLADKSVGQAPPDKQPSGTTSQAQPDLQARPSPVISAEGKWNLPPGAPPPAVASFSADEARKHQERWAAHLKVPLEITNSIGMKLILIPPGEFTMGSTKELIEEELKTPPIHLWYNWRLPSEGPQHRVRITKPFYLGVTEVTQEEYQRVVGANPSYFAATGGGKDVVAGQDTKRFPVEQVSWDEARAFCERLSAMTQEQAVGRIYLLPTEAQWEYACRAGTTTKWFCGDDEPGLGDFAWYDKNSGGRPNPVGQRKANPLGLYDVHGNVWEWCQDGYEEDYYAKSPTDDPAGPLGGFDPVLRGGCWHLPVGVCRSADRGAGKREFQLHHAGFRVCLVLAEKSLGQTPIPAPPPVVSRTAEEIAARRQEFLDKYLKPLTAAKPEDVPEAKYADQFPPKQKFDLTLPTTGNTVRYFADFDGKRLLDAARATDGTTPYFKGHFDGQERLRQMESYGKDGGLTDNPSLGCAAVRYWYNAQGLLIQEACFDTARKPCENNRLEVVACHAYDAEGKRVESRYFDGNGQPAEDRLAVHRRSYLAGKEPLEYRLDGTHRERWLPAVNLGKRINQGATWYPCLSPDQKEMYFSKRNCTDARSVIHRSVWQDEHWSDPKPVLAGGEPLLGIRAAISSDGLVMVFVAWKKDPHHNPPVEYPDLPNYGGADLYVTERKDGQWQAVRNAGPKVNASNEEAGHAFVPGTHTLCLTANDPKTGQFELWLADREGDQWGSPRPLGLQPARHPGFSPDGNRLYFTAGRKGGFGFNDVWMAKKQAGGWSRPINLGSPEVNGGETDDDGPCLTGDGMVLYYSRCNSHPWAIYVTGRADNEAAIRHVAEIYAHAE